MGIKQLTKLLADHAPAASRETTLADFNGRKLAIDASMAIYQFLVAVRSSDGKGPSQQLMNEAGEVTSHITGMWYRTLKFIEAGIKPVYVFDGKPPTLKSGELAKRKEAKAKAAADLEAAKDAGNVEDMDRFARRTVKMGSEHIEDCKKLLRLMGMPVVEAPCEAEAQCAVLAKSGAVYAAASEDMDTLCFGAPKLVRRLWAAEAAKLPVIEITLNKALEGLGLSMDQFIDTCILAGCDYCEPIKGVAATTAYNLVKKHGAISSVVKSLDKEKHPVPEGCDYEEVRRLFTTPEVADPAGLELKWGDPDEEGIKKFLVEEKGFSLARVEPGIAKLKKARSSGSQMRMDSFFSVVPSAIPAKPKAAGGAGGAAGKGKGKEAGTKRKADDKGKGVKKSK